MHIIQEIGPANFGRKYWEHDVVTLEIFNFIEKVGNQDGVLLGVLGVLGPYVGQVPGHRQRTNLVWVFKVSVPDRIPVSIGYEEEPNVQ